MKNIDLLKFVVYFCFMWRCTGHVTMTVVVYFNSSTGPTINPNKTLGSQFFKGQLVIQFLFIFTLFMANNFSHTIWKSVNWSKTHEQAEQTKASASKHLFILITHLCESRDLINIEHAYSRHSLPQAGFDPPARVILLMKQTLYPQATTAGYLCQLFSCISQIFVFGKKN